MKYHIAIITLILSLAAGNIFAQAVIVTVSTQSEIADSGIKGLTVTLVGDPTTGRVSGAIGVEPSFGDIETVVLCVYDSSKKQLVRAVLGDQVLEPKFTVYEFSIDSSVLQESEVLISQREEGKLGILKIKLNEFVKIKKGA